MVVGLSPSPARVRILAVAPPEPSARANSLSEPAPRSDAAHPDPRPHPGRGSGVEVWLVRHAEVHEDWQGKAYGDLDVPLSASGRKRSGELARALARLRPAAVLSSPLERALELGRAVVERSGAPLVIEDDLKEIHRGRWQGLTVAELHRDEADAVRAFYADPWRWCGHGGESDARLAARVWPVVEKQLARRAGARVVLTTHYNVIRVIAAGALGIAPARSFAFRVDPGRAALLVDAPGGWRLRHSNVEVVA